jgi:probable rRNA maturation factor
MLGDIIISYQTIVSEASEQNKLAADHLRHMVVHGILHLLGYDHENDEDAVEMETLETEILSSLGFPNPY